MMVRIINKPSAGKSMKSRYEIILLNPIAPKAKTRRGVKQQIAVKIVPATELKNVFLYLFKSSE
jgi:hypothetical protein